MDDVKALTERVQQWAVENPRTARDMGLSALLAALAAPRPSGEREAPADDRDDLPALRAAIYGQPTREPADLVALVRAGIPRYLQNGGCSNCGGVPHTDTCLIGQLQACMDKLSALRPSPPGERPACPWTEDEDGIWHTGCGRSWDFEAGGVVENRQTYCMGCGHPVAAAPFIEGRRS